MTVLYTWTRLLPIHHYNIPQCLFVKHERYGQGSGAFPNDISLVQFDRAVSGTYIAPVPMATAGTNHAGNPNCYITGWGKDGEYSSK